MKTTSNRYAAHGVTPLSGFTSSSSSSQGLPNIGASCYLNCVIHFLRQIKDLGGQSLLVPNAKNSPLALIFHQTLIASPRLPASTAAANILSQIVSFLFQSRDPQDAGECLQLILDRFYEEDKCGIQHKEVGSANPPSSIYTLYPNEQGFRPLEMVSNYLILQYVIFTDDHTKAFFPSIIQSFDFRGHEYELVAVICHCGHTIHNGHYMIYIQNEEDGITASWTCYDDMAVTRVEPFVIPRERTPYVLLYKRGRKEG